MKKGIFISLSIFLTSNSSLSFEEKKDSAVACAESIMEFKQSCGPIRVETPRKGEENVRDSSVTCGENGPNKHVRILLVTSESGNTCQVIETRRNGEQRITRYSDQDQLTKTVLYLNEQGSPVSQHYYGKDGLLSNRNNQCQFTSVTGHQENVACPSTQTRRDFFASGFYGQNNPTTARQNITGSNY